MITKLQGILVLNFVGSLIVFICAVLWNLFTFSEIALYVAIFSLCWMFITGIITIFNSKTE